MEVRTLQRLENEIVSITSAGFISHRFQAWVWNLGGISIMMKRENCERASSV